MSPSRSSAVAVHGNGHRSVPPEFGLPARRHARRRCPGAHPVGAAKRGHGHESRPWTRVVHPDGDSSGQQCDRATLSVQRFVRCSRGEGKWWRLLQPAVRRVCSRQPGGRRRRSTATTGLSPETGNRVRQDMGVGRVADCVPISQKTHGGPGSHGSMYITPIRSRSTGIAPVSLVRHSGGFRAVPFAWQRSVTVAVAQ